MAILSTSGRTLPMLGSDWLIVVLETWLIWLPLMKPPTPEHETNTNSQIQRVSDLQWNYLPAKLEPKMLLLKAIRKIGMDWILLLQRIIHCNAFAKRMSGFRTRLKDIQMKRCGDFLEKLGRFVEYCCDFHENILEKWRGINWFGRSNCRKWRSGFLATFAPPGSYCSTPVEVKTVGEQLKWQRKEIVGNGTPRNWFGATMILFQYCYFSAHPSGSMDKGIVMVSK